MKSWTDRAEFKSRVRHFADKIGVKVKTVSLRPMATKWASCSTSGNLNFNAELLEMEKDIGDYVIVHELLHFTAPNHSKLWKSLMRVHLGDYEEIEHHLREYRPMAKQVS